MNKKNKIIISILTVALVIALAIFGWAVFSMRDLIIATDFDKKLVLAIVVSAVVSLTALTTLSAFVTHYIMNKKLKNEQHRLNVINGQLRTRLHEVQEEQELQVKDYKELYQEHIQLIRSINTNATKETRQSDIDSRIEMERKIDEERILSQEEIDCKTHVGSTDPEGDLENLIGLQNIKQDLLDIIAEFEFDKKRAERGIQTINHRGSHMIFLGAPGTGKTTVARIMTGILYKYGYIKENKLVDINATELTGKYVGWTTEKTKKYVAAARGGVLFLDEVYSLKGQGAGSDYSSEATSVLLKEMEDNRDSFVVIVAGYKNPTLNWLASNEGLRSRFTKTFTFEDYTADECSQIFVREARKNYFDCTEEFLSLYKRYINARKSCSSKDSRGKSPLEQLRVRGHIEAPRFANARQAETDFVKVKAYHVRNYRSYSYDYNVEDIFVKEDIQYLLSSFKDEFECELTIDPVKNTSTIIDRRPLE